MAERRALAGKEETRPASVMLPGDGARIVPPDPDPPNAFKSAGVAETQPLQEAGRVGQPCSFELREPPIPSYDQYVERLCRSRNLRYFSNRDGRPQEQLSLSYGLAAGVVPDRAMLDTGASLNIATTAFCRRHGIPIQRSRMKVRGFSGVSEAMGVTPPVLVQYGRGGPKVWHYFFVTDGDPNYDILIGNKDLADLSAVIEYNDEAGDQLQLRPANAPAATLPLERRR